MCRGPTDFQADTNTFTLLEGNAVDGTNCLLHSSSGQYLCVSQYLPVARYSNKKTDHGPCLATSSLDFDTVKGTPQQKFMFDFVPRSTDTFAIRSHYNGKFVRCVKKLDREKLDGRYHENLDKIHYDLCITQLFPVDATLETATEFAISSPSITSSFEHQQKKGFTIE